ncbi:MAG: hypothetical protein HN929_05845 [Chloroflexi bacterium]|jgi:hypothetical protein|nr:hypothetical protein [Chloroflexota bacterium]MBT7080973.1 hypothetical protein [Chloroflexota bacterium]MBT7290550.1 hypothetical protein [Chloroflexota bacterium]
MKLLKLVLIAMIMIIPISVLSCSPATATPKGTVNAWLDATVAENAQATVSYETENFMEMTTAERIETYEMAFETAPSFSITNRVLTIESETESSATIAIDFRLIVVQHGDSTEVDESLTVDLIKVDGEWLISEEY